MLLADVSIRRPVFASMMVLAVIVFGVFAFRTLGIDRYPRVDMPIVTITTTLEGASLQVMEKDVTDLIEEAVNTINGIKHLRSSTVEGLSLVLVEFELDREIDVATQEVRDRLATIRKDLPKEIDPPIVEKVDPDAQPIMTIAVFGNLPIGRLTEDVADHVIKRRIERRQGVGQVKIVGGLKREIKAWVDLRNLLRYRISAQEVAGALQRNHLELPGGRVENSKKEFVLRSMGEMATVSDFNDIIITNPPGRPVYFSDVGHIEDGLEEERTLSRLNGRRAVSLFVRKQSGTNTVAVIDGVKEELAKLQPLLPPGVDVQVVQDQSKFIKESVNDVLIDIALGSILTVLIILFFLRNLRTTLIVSVSIPASLIGAFILFQILDFSLNYMTLLGLSLCIGIVVDDSIVVLECIYRHLEEGESPMEAARNGASEIGLATIATTLSIIAIFVPVAYMQGMMGRWFFSFAMTVAVTVGISLLVALTVIPMFSSRILSHRTHHGMVYRLLGRFFDAIDRSYGRLLRLAVRHRYITLLITVIVFALSFKVAKMVGTEFYTEPDEAQFNVGLKLPVGTSMPRAGQMIEEVEERLQALPEVVYVYANIGGGSKEKITDASIYVKMTEKRERSIKQREIMVQAREALGTFPAIKSTVERVSPVQRGQTREAPVEFMVKGQDMDRLIEYSEVIMRRMRTTPGFVDVDSSHEGGKPEIRIEIDRQKAAELGTDVETISSTLRMMVGGEIISHYKEGGERYDVRIRLYDRDRDEPMEIAKVPQLIHEGLMTSSHNLISLHQDSGPTEINRHNRARQVTIYAQLEGRTLGEAIADVNGIVEQLDLPSGYFIEFTGRAEMMKESFHNLIMAILISTIAIYMVLASQFESLIHPFTILFSLPLSIIGAFGALLLTGYHFDLFGAIGLILLMGIVKKNAILLVDYTNTLRRRGMERDEAICRAGPVRLRPILMTSIAVIFGMLPIATGHGAGGEQRAPMGIVVIGGNIASTVLTLVVIPVLYSFWDDLGKWSGKLVRGLQRFWAGKKAPAELAEAPGEAYSSSSALAGELGLEARE